MKIVNAVARFFPSCFLHLSGNENKCPTMSLCTTMAANRGQIANAMCTKDEQLLSNAHYFHT